MSCIIFVNVVRQKSSIQSGKTFSISFKGININRKAYQGYNKY